MVKYIKSANMSDPDFDWDSYYAELRNDYQQRAISDISDQTRKNFADLKELVTVRDNLEYIDGFYFSRDAIDVAENRGQYHLNKYMDLTVVDLLNAVEDFDTVEDAIDDLFNDYKPEYAYSWSENFINALDNLDFSVLDYGEFANEEF